MIKINRVASLFLICVGTLLSPGLAQAQNYIPHDGKITLAPDDWLLNNGRPWFYHGTPAAQPSEYGTRAPTADEQPVVQNAQNVFAGTAAKAMVLLDGHNVVYSDMKSPATMDSYFMSMSMAKTITSMVVGKAICAGDMAFTTKAEDLIPELKGKALGRATVRDLLMMASGAKDDNKGEVMSLPENKLWNKGELNLLDVIVNDRLSGQKKGLFHDYQPGEQFWYNGAEPLTLGIMINAATKSTFSDFAMANVFQPAGVAHPVIIGVDKFGHAAAEGNVRMKMDDWIRLAIWAKDSAKSEGCFGDYMREADRTEIKNTAKSAGVIFDGYGFFTWTDNPRAPHTYWALGVGGQMIGWSDLNDRIIIVFSNSASVMPDVYTLFNAWTKLKD
jgi:CubicO group peptidase (beta-lactamase class C family)